MNPFTDEKNDEFFGPRTNTGKIQYQYYVDLEGTAPPSVDWTQYTTNVKD